MQQIQIAKRQINYHHTLKLTYNIKITKTTYTNKQNKKKYTRYKIRIPEELQQLLKDTTQLYFNKKEDNKINFNLSIQNILKENINEGTITIKDTNNNTLLEQDITGNEIPINITPTEDNLINIEYTGEDYYSDTTQTINITIPPTETTTTLTVPETIITKTPTTLTATVTTIDGTPINGGTITFTQGNEAIATATVTDGTATATSTFTQEGDATIVASYTPESTGLSTSSAEATTSIQAPVTQLNIEEVNLTAGETVTLTATVKDQAGNNINGGKVVFKVNGKTIKDANGKVVYAKVVDGVATVEYTVPTTGDNVTITASYSGSKGYNAEKTTVTMNITKEETTLTVTPIETLTPGSDVTLTATLSDNTINTGKIVFKINGKTVKDANGKVIYAKVVNGTVSVDYTLPESYKAGNYTVTATFIASGYDKLVANTTMTVEN